MSIAVLVDSNAVHTYIFQSSWTHDRGDSVEGVEIVLDPFEISHNSLLFVCNIVLEFVLIMPQDRLRRL